MRFYKPLVLPVVAGLRSLVLDAKRRGDSAVYLLPLAEGEVTRVVVEARETWPENTTGLTQMPDPLPVGWDVLVAPS